MQEPENLSQMQSELENLKSQLNQQQQENETLVKDKANLVEEIQDWVKKSNENSQEKAGIKKDMEELQHQLIEITKVFTKKDVIQDFFPKHCLIFTIKKLLQRSDFLHTDYYILVPNV